jgi:hypothetical protein
MVSVLVALAGCGSVADTDVFEEAAQGGCKQVCPKCKPGQVCPMIACTLDCGPHTCPLAQLCIMGFHWSEAQCKCIADRPMHGPSSCRTADDCRLFADYCTGCDCRALGSHEADPSCQSPSGIRCLADPCATYTVACISGSCSVW